MRLQRRPGQRARIEWPRPRLDGQEKEGCCCEAEEEEEEEEELPGGCFEVHEEALDFQWQEDELGCRCREDQQRCRYCFEGRLADE